MLTDTKNNPAHLVRLAAVTAQLALLVVLVDQYEIENRAFFQLSLLATGGFVMHALLPPGWRLTFFALLSVASVFLVLGLTTGLSLLAMGMVLIGMCHLPIAYWKRIAMIVLAAALFSAMRAGLVESPLSDAVWPILGSMFMFRLAVYLYDLRHGRTPVTPARTISYFFMLPNVCFPLFPVIDYTRFNKHYYDQDEWRIYQRGVHWMLRGIVQLLLYRLVYHNLVLDPAEVDGFASFVQYSLAAFLLYLRVSGLFHLIVGMLLLFGFNLHETHHLYYLSAGFTDFWRRINIYWKDFMMKLFYYPVRFYLKGSSDFSAILISTLVVFSGTWVLHSYQWFWLRGDVLLEWHDGLFWTILALLVIVNSLYELKNPPLRTIGGVTWTLPRIMATASRTAGTFITICLLWSLWSSDSLGQWLNLVGKTGVAGFLLFVSPLVLFGTSRLLRPLEQRAPKSGKQGKGSGLQQNEFWLSATATGTVAAVLCLASLPDVHGYLPQQLVAAVETARDAGPNKRDRNIQERGYYEHLMAVNRQNTRLHDLYSKRPADWVNFMDTAGWKVRADLQEGDVMPNLEMEFKGATLRTNSRGMRDREYPLAKPEGRFRIAALGASVTFGSGVEDDETFEHLFESLLNDHLAEDAFSGIEVLNFGAPNRLGLRQLMSLRETVLDFGPDAVFYLAHGQDLVFPITSLAVAINNSKEIPFDYIRQLVQKAGVNSGMPDHEIRALLQPYARDIVRWTYEQIVSDCRERGILPVWIYVPLIYEREMNGEILTLMDIARNAGFITLNIIDAFAGYSQARLTLRAWDDHPNTLGHRLLADSLYRVVHENQGALFGRAVLDNRQPAAASSGG